MSDDLPSVFSQKMRKAKRTHKCCECKKEICKGEKYQYAKGCWDSKWADFKTCEPCADLRDELGTAAYDEYPAFGELAEWAHEAGIEFITQKSAGAECDRREERI